MSTQKIFFSYSRADSPFALTLAKDLREAGADIWIDQLDIPAGSHWDAAVEKALNSAAFVLVILTTSSTQSTNVMDEVSFALESGKKIIPVLLEDCLAPFRLRRLQRIDFTLDYTVGFNQLLVSLNLSMGSVAKAEGVPFEPIEANPVAPVSVKDTNEKEKRDNLHWEEACRHNTIHSYRKYMNENPAGLFLDEAKLMIKQLEVEQKEEELEALLWQKAKNENVKNLYQHYLQEYPQGNYKTLAMSAIAEFEKVEKAEVKRLQDIALQQEKELAQKAKEEKEKEEQLQREKAQKAKEEREKEEQLQREKAQKAKEEKEKEEQLQREKAQKDREEKEKEAQQEKARLQKVKEEKEKQLQEEKEKAVKIKLEQEKLAALEKEKTRLAKEETEKQLRLEKEKAKKEKEEIEKAKQQEKEKALLAKQQEKERLARERQLAGGGNEPPASSKKYILIGAGVLLLGLGIWGITRMGGSEKRDDRQTWNDALQKNDSTSFAQYMEAFPEGKYYSAAKERIDSLYWLHKTVQDSLNALALANAPSAEAEIVSETPTPVEEVKTEPAADTKTGTNTPAKPKATTPAKPKGKTPPAKTDNKPANAPVKVALGQEYGGGIVIYVSAKGDHGMIVSSKEGGSVSWDKAQKICAAYTSGNISGWRLPSKEELNIIYQNRKYLGDYIKGSYWSASEEGKNSAWTQNFSNGKQDKSNKQSSSAVRAVKPF